MEAAVVDEGLLHGVELAVLGYAFGDLKLNRVELTTAEENVRAIRSYEKCGFVREGVLREHRLIDGRPVDSVAMAVIRSDWEAR